MQDFYDVPNFARAVWGVQRVVDLWGISPLRPEEMCLHAQLKWQNWGHRSQTMRDVQKTYDLVFVLGGRDPSRTYASWLTVAQQVAQAQTTAGISSLRVGLIGVGNRALSDAQALLCLGLPWQIENWVNQTSFAQGIAHLERTRVVLVADGGAMHMASLAQVSYMVSLFTQHVLPGYRIADCYHPYALVSESTDVNGISPQAVAKQALRALSAQSIFP
jgi:hypothetical protein